MHKDLYRAQHWTDVRLFGGRARRIRNWANWQTPEGIWVPSQLAAGRDWVSSGPVSVLRHGGAMFIRRNDMPDAWLGLRDRDLGLHVERRWKLLASGVREILRLRRPGHALEFRTDFAAAPGYAVLHGNLLDAQGASVLSLGDMSAPGARVTWEDTTRVLTLDADIFEGAAYPLEVV